MCRVSWPPYFLCPKWHINHSAVRFRQNFDHPQPLHPKTLDIMSANNSSAVNAMGNNTPPLLSLPAELVDMVAQALDKPADLLSLRSTCHQLRNGSAREFCKRFFEDLEISGTGSSVRELTDMLLSPSFPWAQHLARSLKATAPRVGPSWPVDITHLRKHLSPSPEDVARLFAAMPKLEQIFLSDCNSEDPSREVSAVHSAPLLLKSLSAPGPHLPHLRQIILLQVCVEGDVLAKVLEAHKHSLEEVFLCMVRTTGSSASWIEVLETLHSTNVSSMRLGYLEAEGDGGNTMRVRFSYELCEKLQYPDPDGMAIQSNIDTKRVKPVLEVILRAFKSSVWLEEGTWW